MMATLLFKHPVDNILVCVGHPKLAYISEMKRFYEKIYKTNLPQNSILPGMKCRSHPENSF